MYLGKTVLASVVVDEARANLDAPVVFFYCKHKQTNRNSFLGVAKSLLVQMLTQKPEILPHLFEKAALDIRPLISSSQTAQELLKIGFTLYEKLFIVLDGLDECEKADRDEIATWFQETIDTFTTTKSCFVKCLFVSQRDGIAFENFQYLQAVHIEKQNQNDLREYASVCHSMIERKFGDLKSSGHDMSQILVARAQGRSSI
jgi:hypothetical protein